MNRSEPIESLSKRIRLILIHEFITFFELTIREVFSRKQDHVFTFTQEPLFAHRFRNHNSDNARANVF